MHVKTFWLRKVYDVELNRSYPALVTDLKVEPLVVSSRVWIDPHVQVKFIFFNLNRHVEIARLKIAVKKQVLAWFIASKFLELFFLLF
jgi:hypothetical protein